MVEKPLMRTMSAGRRAIAVGLRAHENKSEVDKEENQLIDAGRPHSPLLLWVTAESWG
jgi:hypothetical protein